MQITVSIRPTMANPDLRRGQPVKIQLDRHDEPRTVKVLKVPPYDDPHMDQTVEDKVLIEYPGSAPRGGKGLFGNLQEAVPLDSIVEA